MNAVPVADATQWLAIHHGLGLWESRTAHRWLESRTGKDIRTACRHSQASGSAVKRLTRYQSRGFLILVSVPFDPAAPVSVRFDLVARLFFPIFLKLSGEGSNLPHGVLFRGGSEAERGPIS